MTQVKAMLSTKSGDKMRGPFLVLAISLTVAVGQTTNEIETCTTLPTPTGTSRPEPCVFPFSFDNVTFFEVINDLTVQKKVVGCVIEKISNESWFPQCTPHKHIDQRKWCSVEVDERGVHVSGKARWGNCDPAKCGKTAPKPMTTTNMDNCGRICRTVIDESTVSEQNASNASFPRTMGSNVDSPSPTATRPLRPVRHWKKMRTTQSTTDDPGVRLRYMCLSMSQ